MSLDSPKYLPHTTCPTPLAECWVHTPRPCCCASHKISVHNSNGGTSWIVSFLAFGPVVRCPSCQTLPILIRSCGSVTILTNSRADRRLSFIHMLCLAFLSRVAKLSPGKESDCSFGQMRSSTSFFIWSHSCP